VTSDGSKPTSGDRLDRALGAMRAETGESTLAQQTLDRVLSDQRAARQAKWRRARVWIPLAATLAVVSTAALARWGVGMSARAPTSWKDAPEVPSRDAVTTGAPLVALPAPAGTGSTTASSAEDVAPPEARVEPATPALVTVPSALAASARPRPSPSPATNPAPAPGPPAPSAPAASEGPSEADVYASAHRLHFDGAPPAAALGAWDDYLRRFPDGRFTPDARYNRAIVLLKLHRYAEGRAALQPFADGAVGGYHRDDARELLRTIP
jgi:TolA-binding protein